MPVSWMMEIGEAGDPILNWPLIVKLANKKDKKKNNNKKNNNKYSNFYHIVQ